MNRTLLRAASLGLMWGLASSPLPVQAQDVAAPAATATVEADTEKKPRKKRFQLGPEFSVFRLTDSRSRARFGDTKYSIGIGFTPIPQATAKGKLGLDFKLFYLKRNNNRAIWAPIGVEYRKAIGEVEENARYRPYFGATVNAVPANIKAPLDGVDTKLRVGLGGSAFVGTQIGKKAYLEARYFAVTKISTFDLSGANIAAGFRF